MKTILIFEPLSGGHRSGYIRWLTDSITNNSPRGYHFIFVTDPGVDIPSAAPLSYHKISPELARRLKSSGPARLSGLLRDLFDECVAQYSPDHALILELTRLEFSFALRGAPCSVSAILFVQYPELPRGLKFFFKDWKTALLLRRAPIKNLFLLNGEESCRYLTARFGSQSRFIPVPDPAPEIKAEAGFSVRREYRIGDGRTVFLFFGAVSPRKGADVLIEALHLLPPEAAAKSAFLFCGEPERSYKQAFAQDVARLRAARPDITLNIEPRFVSDPRMMALFEQSDVVLMPYTRPEYSSGILALAAKARTPVIGPDSGLLGRLIRQNGLGAVCPVRPETVAESIVNATQRLPAVDESLCSAFVQKSRPELFARTILNAVCNER
ncbi:MAG: glycosyltransferase [Kiritimatiellales bacterium]